MSTTTPAVLPVPFRTLLVKGSLLGAAESQGLGPVCSDITAYWHVRRLAVFCCAPFRFCPSVRASQISLTLPLPTVFGATGSNHQLIRVARSRWRSIAVERETTRCVAPLSPARRHRHTAALMNAIKTKAQLLLTCITYHDTHTYTYIHSPA